VVFASSIAIYGQHYPALVDRQTRPIPASNYGTHKLMAEIALANHSRAGLLDGVSIRLPGIVARPGISAGHGSAFMSAVMHAAAQSAHYACPVSSDATCWWMSLACCVDNLVHAMTLPAMLLEDDRSCQLPVLSLSLGQVIEALARRFGASSVQGISHEPDSRIEALFGRQPFLSVPGAEKLGFTDDGTADALIARALGSSESHPGS
jgi:nucleoside-diphosphate-sugar epimerase